MQRISLLLAISSLTGCYFDLSDPDPRSDPPTPWGGWDAGVDARLADGGVDDAGWDDWVDDGGFADTEIEIEEADLTGTVGSYSAGPDVYARNAYASEESVTVTLFARGDETIMNIFELGGLSDLEFGRTYQPGDEGAPAIYVIACGGPSETSLPAERGANDVSVRVDQGATPNTIRISWVARADDGETRGSFVMPRLAEDFARPSLPLLPPSALPAIGFEPPPGIE